jgi:hypothetical protein
MMYVFPWMNHTGGTPSNKMCWLIFGVTMCVQLALEQALDSHPEQCQAHRMAFKL